MGAYSLGQGFLNSSSSTRFDELLQQLEKLHAEYALKLQDALGSSQAAHAALDSLAKASNASLKQASEVFEEQVVMAETLDAPWQGFYDNVSQLMAQTYQLDEATLAFLGHQLEQRLAQYRTHMVVLVCALAAVFLLIFYLYAGFYASTRTTLRRLGGMMDKVAAGDMTVTFVAHSRDELTGRGVQWHRGQDPRPDRARRPHRRPGRAASQPSGGGLSPQQPGGVRPAQPDRASGDRHEPDVLHGPGSGAQCGGGGQQRP
ncbi:hypothetical protein [Pseudomonas sp. VD9]|uniref:hypothetical protein n=1 Tax=Pseudomonas sp. VD9 TaxID=3342076 RepID=UPI003C6C89EC